MKKDAPRTGLSLESKVGLYEASICETRDARRAAERDRDYIDNKQYTAEEEAILKKRKQPIVTNNRMAPKLDFLCGLEEQHRTDPKAFPRTPKHEKEAQAVGDAIRFVMDQNQSDFLLSDTFKELMVEGTEAVEIVVDRESPQYDIKINWVMWDRLFYDHHSRKSDFSDSTFHGQFIWMDLAKAKDKWPGKENELSVSMGSGDEDNTYEDAPRVAWGNEKRKRVRIVEMHYLHKGEWWRSVFCKGGELEPDAISPYKDEYGGSVPSMVMQSMLVDREGNRYGAMRVYVSPQDSVNKRESKMVHLLNHRQTFGDQHAVENPAKVKRELAKPDGHVELRAGSQFGVNFGIIPTGDMAAGQFSLLQEGKAQIDQAGVNAVLQGSDGTVMSGRAREQINQGAMTQSLPLLEPHRRFKHNIYRQVWYRIKQYWTEEKWVRVTDEENNLKFVGLNRKVTLREKLEEQGHEIPPEAMNDERLDQVVETQNEISNLDVDIIIGESPDTVSIQSEQFAQIAEMYKANPQSAQNPNGIPFDTVVEASNLRGKDELLKKMRGEGEEGKDGGANQAMQAMKQQLEQFQAQAQQQIDTLLKENEELKKKLSDRQAELHVKASEVDSAEEISRLEIDQKDRADARKAEIELLKLANDATVRSLTDKISAMEQAISNMLCGIGVDNKVVLE